MKTIKFKISGKFAHFKKPDVNSNVYFTYSHIHKVALLGIFGAILGLDGYNQNIKDYPEFYKKLRHLKVSIIPKEVMFSKKIITFNNSVGYASKEQGGNLVVKEQWLENPSWEILILDDGSKEFNRLKEKFFNKECVYIPYLGKNDHFANISDVKEIELQKTTKPLVCKSLIPKSKIKSLKQAMFGKRYFYEEYLPVGMKEKFLMYEMDKMVLSSGIIESDEMWEYEGKGIIFT